MYQPNIPQGARSGALLNQTYIIYMYIDIDIYIYIYIYMPQANSLGLPRVMQLR